MTKIHMVYDRVIEDPYTADNLTACDDLIPSHDDGRPGRRFNHSMVVWWLQAAGYQLIDHELPDRPPRYVYASSTYNGPSYWAGWSGNQHGFSSLFQFIPAPVSADIAEGRALLLIDQMMEGYSDDNLWPWLHDEMLRLGYPDHSIIYWSGNYLEADRYTAWCKAACERPRVHVGSLRHLEMVSQRSFGNQKPTTWKQHLLRRMQIPDMRLYNCLNRADRYHRNVMFMELYHGDLLHHGLVSMQRLSWDWKLGHDDLLWTKLQVSEAQSCLPLLIDLESFNINPAFGINHQLYDRTWLSLITETMADDEPHSLFITEKVFKCMHQSHPFMVLGQRGHLRQLRDWGYQTFHEFWDESYDDLPDVHQRASAIAGQLRHLATRPDMAGRIDEMREIVQHNLEHFLSRSCKTAESDALAALLISHMRGN